MWTYIYFEDLDFRFLNYPLFYLGVTEDTHLRSLFLQRETGDEEVVVSTFAENDLLNV